MSWQHLSRRWASNSFPHPYCHSYKFYIQSAPRLVARVACVLLGAAVLWLAAGNRAWAEDETRQESLSLLRRCLETQTLTNHVSMRIVADLRNPDLHDDFRDRRGDTRLLRDGDRLDVNLQILFNPLGPGAMDRSQRSRLVLTKDIGVWYWCPVSKTTPPRKGVVNHDWEDWFNRKGINELTGGPLDGYFPPTGTHRAAEIMAESDSLRIRGKETLAGTPCHVVEATTPHGSYAMWIAESKGFLPLKVTY